MAIRYLREARQHALDGTALLRLDFNTKDDWRMRAVLPTVKFLLKNSGNIVVMSHRGRPEGVRLVNGIPRGFKKNLSLKNDAAVLARLIRRKVVFISHFRFDEIRKQIAEAPRGSVFLLENLRFLPGEEKNDARLAKQLASLGDFYVNDAFAVSHRANASVAAVPRLLPHYAGFELEEEILSLSRVMKAPQHPLIVILGGAKAADKLGVIKFFERRTDGFLLGGGPANTVLSLAGVDVKKSVRDADGKDLKALRGTLFAGGKIRKNIFVPVDFAWQGNMILDIGPRTRAAFGKKIASARTILWSGPLGLIEKRQYAQGSIAVARAIGRNRRAFRVAGGGETVMFLKAHRLEKNFSFISTGGGAMMDFLAGKRLPGIAALE